MSDQDKLIAKYGNPIKDQHTFETKWMMLLKYPADIKAAIPQLGDSVYCNKDFADIYVKFLRLLIERKLSHEITVNDQCFMVRMQRGSLTEISIHSWGMAVDLNPVGNPLGFDRAMAEAKGLVPFTKEFQQCGRDAGLVCGYDFGPNRCDGMHFQHTNGL